MSRMSRREFLATVGAAGAGLLAGRTLAAQEAPAADNVLILMTDQQTASALHAAGNGLIRTPNLDRLAREGVRFTNACCPTPFCSPTRASMVTGRYPHGHGLERNVEGRESYVDDTWQTTEGLLYQAGFTTEHRGKWHLGPRSDVSYYAAYGDREGQDWNQRAKLVRGRWPQPPEEPGAQAWGAPVTIPPTVQEAHRKYLEWEKRSPQDISIIGRWWIEPADTMPSVLADQVCEMLGKYRDRRFMITWSVDPPHAFWIAPEPYYSMYRPEDMPLPDNLDVLLEYCRPAVGAYLGQLLGPDGLREYVRCYYAMVTLVDWCVGRILDKLDQLGLAQRTLVLFTSDHGDMQGNHGVCGKSIPAFYEQILRVPLLLRLPGRVPAGKVLQYQANHVDYMPTILDYVGHAIPTDIDGRSLRPLIEGREEDGVGLAFGDRTGKSWFSRMVCDGEWKYVYWSVAKYGELFNLRDDPHENQNLFGDARYRPQRERLHGLLRDWMARTHDPKLEQMPAEPPE